MTTNSMGADKKKLRKHHLEIRARLTTDAALEQSRQILTNLAKLPYWNQPAKVHLYLPIPAQREVDSWELVKKLITDPKFHIFVPAMKGDDMVHFDVTDLDKNDIKPDKRGIPTPSVTEGTHESDFDLIIVPCVVGDLKRHRLGHGGGAYDRFLASQTQAKTIGLCYDINVVEQIPVEAHDIALTNIVTESRII